MSQDAGKVRAIRPSVAPADTAAGCAPLAELNAYIRQVTAARRGAAEAESGVAATDAALHELASVRRFRQAWERGRTQDRLDQALARKPDNAGPLNSHALVLRSLALMNALSPDYLRRFLAQAETLQWLETAREALPRDAPRPAPGKPAGRAKRSPKAARPPAPPT